MYWTPLEGPGRDGWMRTWLGQSSNCRERTIDAYTWQTWRSECVGRFSMFHGQDPWRCSGWMVWPYRVHSRKHTPYLGPYEMILLESYEMISGSSLHKKQNYVKKTKQNNDSTNNVWDEFSYHYIEMRGWMMKHVETKFKILMKPGVDHFREMCFVCFFVDWRICCWSCHFIRVMDPAFESFYKPLMLIAAPSCQPQKDI